MDLDRTIDDAGHAVQVARGLELNQRGNLRRLADALAALWLALSSADRHEDALVVAEEAVAIWRILAEDPHERLYLATALDMLTASLSYTEDQAFGTAADELLRLRAELANEASAELAGSLIAVADRHTALDQHAAARPLLEQAVALRRQLVSTGVVEEFDLLVALTGLRHCLSDLGEHERGLEVAAEAVRLARTIPDLSPTDLASVLLNLVDSLRTLRRDDEADPLEDEAGTLLRDDEQNGDAPADQVP
jgi:hypothetical protein